MIRSLRRWLAKAAFKLAEAALRKGNAREFSQMVNTLMRLANRSEDEIILTLAGRVLVMSGWLAMRAGNTEEAVDLFDTACDILMKLRTEPNALKLAHAIGESTNDLYERGGDDDSNAKARFLFETLLSRLIGRIAPGCGHDAEERSDALLQRLEFLELGNHEPFRLLVAWLAVSCGVVATDRQCSADSMRYLLQAFRSMDGLLRCPAQCMDLAIPLFMTLAFEYRRHGNSEGERHIRERAAVVLEQAGVPAGWREELITAMEQNQKLQAGIHEAVRTGDFNAVSRLLAGPGVDIFGEHAKAMAGHFGEMASGDTAQLEEAAQKAGGPSRNMTKFFQLVAMEPDDPGLLQFLLPSAFSRDAQLAWRSSAILGVALDPTNANLPQLAILFGKLAVRTLQRMRLDLAQQRLKSLNPFNDEAAERGTALLCDQLTACGRLGEALRYSETVNAERYLPPPKLASVQPLVEASCPLTVPEREVIESLRLVATTDQSGVEAILGECRRLESRLNDSLPRAPHVVLEGEQPLPIDAILLSVNNDGRTIIATLSGEFGTRTEVVQLTPSELYDTALVALQALSSSTSKFDHGWASLKVLHEALLTPFMELIEDLGARVLLVQANGALRRIPFAVLHDGQRYLVERIAIVAHPGSIPLRLSRGLRTPVSAASIAVSEVPGLRPLPFVHLDSCVLRQTVVGGGLGQLDALLDEDASAERVESLLATKPTLLHISSHFEVDHADASRSTFLLAGGQRYTLAQLARQDLASVDLALMLGCETQSVSEVDGAFGITAIDSLLLRMGVGAVVGSAWSVRDDLAHAMLTRFLHEVFTQGNDLAGALRTAILSIARDPVTGAMSHPHEWGAFVLSGDWSCALGQVVDGLEAPM